MRYSACVRLGLAVVASAVAMSAVTASASAPFKYWYTGSQAKIYRATTAPTSALNYTTTPSTRVLAVDLAKSEYEGRQIAIRAAVPLTEVWFETSELVNASTGATISADNLEFKKVEYVNIKTPTYGYKTTGIQPDPLVPMTLVNGARLGSTYRAIPANQTQPFFVSLYAPEATPPGTYNGTITLTAKNGSQELRQQIPVRMTVHPFSVKQRTLRTMFGVSWNHSMRMNSSTGKWLGAGSGPNRVTETTSFAADQQGAWLKMLSDYRLSPRTLPPAWTVASDGTVGARTAYLNDYLGSGTATTFDGQRYNFNTTTVPGFVRHDYLLNPFSSSTATNKASTYYTTMGKGLSSYTSKTYFYLIDEPPGSQRAFITKYADFVHKKAPGTKVLVTLSGVDFGYKPVAGVDVYVQRLHFWYRDQAKWINPLRNTHKKQVWMYSHAGQYVAQAPNFAIDGPVAAPRAMGWFAYHTNAPGMLYFNVNAWRVSQRDGTARDPWLNPLSYAGPYYMNGDGSLVYPGYYPLRGLVVQGAPPVTSLRMEALRDGLEDHEYLKLYERKYGRTATLGKVGKVIGKPTTVVSAGSPTFPSYAKTGSEYSTVRAELVAGLK